MDRVSRLNKVFGDILHGKTLISPSNGPRFLESIYGQQEPTVCIGKLVSSPAGMPALTAAIRYDLSTNFMNNHASQILKYLQTPELKVINNGDFLDDILIQIVDPPIFWNEFRKAFLRGELNDEAALSFGWVLLRLCNMNNDQSAMYREAADMPSIVKLLCSSPIQKVRSMGSKIQEVLNTSLPRNQRNAQGGSEAGGRHDNDFADFRRISIFPTGDEMESKDAPFLRPASILEDPETETSRVALHLDNQFRLLREDMLFEMKEELKIATGEKKGRHRGTKIKGFQMTGLDCGDDKRRTKWGLVCICDQDFPEMKKLETTQERRDYLDDKRHFLRHQSLACLLVDKEIIAFPCIHRDENRLIKNPPEIVLQFEDVESTQHALRRLRMGDDITLIQIDTATFAYEPILKGLQQAKTLPLSSELLLWKKGDPLEEVSEQIPSLVQTLRDSFRTDLKEILKAKDELILDESQAKSLISGLTQKVSLIQGPPGTGKSFIGGLISKAIHDLTERTILVVCYTNHALDEILTQLLNIGIPETSMLRLGGKSTQRTEPLSIQRQNRGPGPSRIEWTAIDELKGQISYIRGRLDSSFNQFISQPSFSNILDYLEMEYPDYFDAFSLPIQADGMILIGGQGKAAQADYLIEKWFCGERPGLEQDIESSPNKKAIWELPISDRKTRLESWKDALLQEAIQAFFDNAKEYNRCYHRLNRAYSTNTTNILRSKRIVGCTTTAAAKYREEIQTFNPDVLLVEEAGEILESHVLTSLGPETSQMILIGDHKQLRPKVNHYLLTVENGEGYDLNRSLFERLILKDYPHETLSVQYRMRPEISDLIRQLTYKDLIDDPKTLNRPNLLGVQDNIVFIQHEHPEDETTRLADRNDMASTSSKQNTFEAQMVLKIVKYLAQQGYGTEHIVVLTPYLGQLHKLREILKKDNDPILNDLDNNELVKAGLIDPSIARLSKRPIRLATIDNYQGEESDVVIVSLTRSNDRNDIGFMFAPERLNVLLSRARNALIMLGNANTFKKSKKGQELWGKLFDLLIHGKHVYEGLPVKCQRHPSTTAIISQPQEFDARCPDGGCLLPCGASLSCGIHVCPSKCHQLSDHSKLPCKERINSKCPDGHLQTWICSKGRPATCPKCERVKTLAKKKQKDDSDAQARRDAEQKAHLERMDALNAQIELERRAQEDARLAKEQAIAIKQKQNDLDSMRMATRSSAVSHNVSDPSQLSSSNRSSPGISPSKSSQQQIGGMLVPTASTTNSPQGSGVTGSNNSGISSTPAGDTLLAKLLAPFTNPLKDNTNPTTSSGINIAAKPTPKQTPPSIGKPFKDLVESTSQKEWKHQKNVEGAQNDAIDAIMDMIGLASVKQRVLVIKAKIDTNIRQNATLKRERFNVVLLGNPGTGKTTIARHYAKFLSNVKAIPGDAFEETTGARLAQNGVSEAEKLVEGVVKTGGGTIFIDEAYQLTSGNNYGGPAVLDFLLAEMENKVGTLVFVLAGYNKEMEKFFEHNPGLKSRVPYQFQFDDYKDEELMWMFEDLLKKTFEGRMKVEDGASGLCGRIAIRRLGRRRNSPGFGNARDLQTVFSQIRERQAARLASDRKDGKYADDFYLTREDLIGPDPSAVIRESKEWITLQNLTGLKAVKDSVKSLFSLIEENFQRELMEQEPLEVSLNKVFLGSPGTGKTTVAKLYGKILADIGLLSNGEVITKNPSDFVGSVLGASEANTKAILANTVGKVLIIDEAYMLYDSNEGGSSGSNQYKTSVIDTIVAEVQSVPGEDRCVIMIGYKDKMVEMFQHVNPGLSRRFKIEDAFNFEDFDDAALLEILERKLKQQDLDATDQAKKIAIEYLSRLRNRPNFGNAGEVDNVITRAKGLAVARRAKLRMADRPRQIVFEAEDIDPEWNRGASASLNLEKLFSDIVGCEDIVSRLKNYQTVVEACRKRDMDPREHIPTNFVFTGPPGTGKTTVARKMGQVFYNMEILASGEVIECSASDLVGQFVGQTGPKTKKLFQKALGKVLFVDEAYRLSVGHFAQEAMDELVGLLTHPDFKSKLVVILAGYEQDMDQLMSVNAGLSSRFPDQVVFRNMDAESCLKVITNELEKKKIQTNGWDTDTTSAVNIEMKELIRDMSELNDWGNARDMITASNQMVNQALMSSQNGDPNVATILSGDDALDVMKTILSDRQRRSKIPAKTRRDTPDDLPQQTSDPDPPTAPSIATANPANTQASPTSTRGRGRGRGGGQRGGRSNPGSVRIAGNTGRARGPQGGVQQVERDAGVSDAIWGQMGTAKRVASEIERDARNKIKDLEKNENDQKMEEQRQKKVADDLEKAEVMAKEASERAELQRQREQARIKELAARAAAEKAAAQLREKREAERLRQETEAKAQQKLREMGVCPAGYNWINMGSVYRCRGGSHVVSVHELGL